jgi:hypothetical protein
LSALPALSTTYHRASRAWSLDELVGVYRAAVERGERSSPPTDRPPSDPVGPLTQAIPHLIRLAAATHVLHVLPELAGERIVQGQEIIDQLYSTVDQTAAEALFLCSLALEASDRFDPVDEWVSHAVEQASDALPHLLLRAQPPSLIGHAEEAGRWVAVAIDLAHADPSAAPRAISDALGHLLVLCAFADLLSGRL